MCVGRGLPLAPHWNDVELILTVQMETEQLVEGYFGSEFRAICNRCGVTAA